MKFIIQIFFRSLLPTPSPLFIEGWNFWKIIERGMNISLQKQGEIHMGEVYSRMGDKDFFSLVMHRFWSNNAFQSESLSFIFLLTLFHTWDFYYFESNLRPLIINYSFIIICLHHSFFVDNTVFCFIICHHW